MRRMNKLDLNPQFQQALAEIEQGKHVFITGRAGTGKSTLLQYFRDRTKKKMAVLAPTGVAAVNVGGQTIHSFFGFKPDITADKVRKEYKNRSRRGLYKNLEAIVIDEISMVRADLLDCVDEFLRLNGRARQLPFGGIQMIFVGDLYQLPPVVRGEDRKIFSRLYPTPYFFSSKVMNTLQFSLVELTKIYRQTDDDFIDILNAVRNNTVEEKHLAALNKRLQPDFRPDDGGLFVHLTTTNAGAEAVNNRHLLQLPGKIFSYQGEIDGEFGAASLPAPTELVVKPEAQVMLVNNDRAGRWINGTMGKIIKIKRKGDGDCLMVQIDSGKTEKVYPHTWEMFRYKFNPDTNRLESETVGSFTQYPVILAWAITIHKSQGKTFERLIIDMERGAFTHGQTYVALSRCTSLEGLILKKPIKKGHIWADWQVMKFLSEFQHRKANLEMPVAEKTEVIRRAVASGGRLEIVYLKTNDQKSRRVIEPKKIGTMKYVGKSFLGVEAFDHLRGEERVFRVDRILKLLTISPAETAGN